MNFEIKKTKLIFSSILTAGLLIFLITVNKQFFLPDISYGILLFILSIVCSLLIGVVLAVDVINIRPIWETLINTVLFFLLPIVSMTMVECLNGVFIYNFYIVDFLNSYCLYLLFYGLFFALFGSFRLSIMITSPIFFLFALAHHFVVKYKGSPFVPMDFLSITTAKDVATSYDYSVNYQIAIAIVLLSALMVLGFKIKTPRMHLSTKIITRTASAVAVIIVFGIYFFTDIFSNCGLEPDFWNQSRGYKKSGFLLNFCINTKYLYLSEPDGYSHDKVDEIIYSLESSDDTVHNDEDYKTPNIICIMNESFADLSVCGNFTTNDDPLKFYNSLQENVVKGNLYVPVHGAGTSNTEYEFLTGNSTSFFPAGSNAYMLYVNEPTSSLVSTMSDLGYSKEAFHPYYTSGWNRKKVYKNFGFESFYNIVSVIKPSILLDYIRNGTNDEYFNDLCNLNYPNQNVLLRQYVSDQYNYDNVIKYYENRDTDKPFFMFNVTMQNHGGYTKSFSNFDVDVKLTSTQGYYPKTENYLSLLKKSDEAFEKLICYFKEVKEPTVICMFGDHQPSIEEEFYEEIMNVDSIESAPLEQRQKRYITPFVIWANYDIDDAYIDKLSVNYLSSYLLKTAKIKTTPYNEYLFELSKKLPVITSVGYIDSNGVHYENGKNTKYSNLLKDYKILQYNNAIDKNNEKKEYFYH